MSVAFAKYHSDTHDDDATPIHLVDQSKQTQNHSPETPSYQRPRSVEHFLAQVEQPLYRFAFRTLKNEQDALEAVQDTLLKWVEKKYSRKPAEEWRPLVYRILQNRLNDIGRHRLVVSKVMTVFSKSTTSQEKTDVLESAPASPNRQPDKIGDNQAFVTALMNALDTLPERQRQAFQYRVGEGLSTKETALAMGCGEGSVMTHLSRANQALRRALERFSDHSQ